MNGTALSAVMGLRLALWVGGGARITRRAVGIRRSISRIVAAGLVTADQTDTSFGIF